MFSRCYLKHRAYFIRSPVFGTLVTLVGLYCCHAGAVVKFPVSFKVIDAMLDPTLYKPVHVHTPCPEKRPPPKHVKITLWIENDNQYFSCIMKSHLFAMFVWNFTTTSLSIAEILLFIKRWSKIAVANIANLRMRHARQYWRQRTVGSVGQRLRNFSINKNKMVV